MFMENWIISSREYSTQSQLANETKFTTANGFFGLRGTIGFNPSKNGGTYIAGCYNKAHLTIPELVNIPDPLAVDVFIQNQNGFERLELTESNFSDFSESFDLRKGIFTYQFNVKTKSGFTFSISQERFVSWKNKHRWGSRYTLQSPDYNGKVFLLNSINTAVINNAEDPVNRTSHFRHHRTYDLRTGIGISSILTDHSRAIHQFTSIEANFDMKRVNYRVEHSRPVELYEFFMKDSVPMVFCKTGVIFFDFEDEKGHTQLFNAKKNFEEYRKIGYEEEKGAHIEAVQKNWEITDIRIKGNNRVQKALRWCIFQLNATAFMLESNASIGAKGLHGEGYKGHIFWDTEIFMFPFFLYTNPQIAKKLLLYRYQTLRGAKENALLSGYNGARFAWESAETGHETTPKWGENYKGEKVRIWTGDIEYHISADVAISIYHYYRATLDQSFMDHYGLEILMETAKFWESRVEYNAGKERYEIKDVIGPDEFHEHVDNNVYTNYLARWNLQYSAFVLESYRRENPECLNEIIEKISLEKGSAGRWKAIAEKIFIPTDPNSNVIEQFEGYFRLKEYRISEYDDNGMPKWPKGLDLGRLNDTSLIKQPDVLMLMYLMPETFSFEQQKENYSFYESRTMHKSSLSPGIHALLGISVHQYEHAYDYFKKTLFTDLSDNQRNTFLGLHAAATGGAWLSAVMGFGRFFVDETDTVNFDPWIPDEWESLSYSLIWRGQKINVKTTRDKLIIHSTARFLFKYRDKTYETDGTHERVVDLTEDKH